jgi:hypothetical protein
LTVDVKVPTGTYLTGEYGQAREIAEFRKPIRCSGAGKSAIAAVLARRGVVSVDADADPLLARFVDPAGTVVTEDPRPPQATAPAALN